MLRSFLKWLPGAFAVPIVIGAASIGPDQAVSNISKWIQWIGISDLPSWLTAQSADRWAIFGALLFSVIYFVAIWAITRSRRGRSVTNLDNTILLSFKWVQPPAVIPKNGYYEIPIVFRNVNVGGFMSSSHPPGSPILYHKGNECSYFYMICFTNFGNTAVLNVTADLEISFRAVINVDNGTISGETISKHIATTSIANLLPGTNEKFKIYIRNLSPYYVDIKIPKKIRCQAVGVNKIQSARLIPVRHTSFGLPPFVPARNPQV